MAKLTVNGQAVELTGHKDKPLLWAVREQLGLTGTKFGCGVGQCRACTVHVNGEAKQSCQVTLEELDGAEVRTIEDLGKKGLHALQQAWIEHNVPQCGYCQSGQLMAASALLERTPNPTDQDIDDAMRNICRCGTYPRMRAAIHAAAKALG